VNRTKLAWAAGFFDGEGWVGAIQAYKRPGCGGLGIRSVIMQKDRRALDKFKQAVGFGKVAGPYAAKGRVNPLYCWRIGQESQVRLLYKLLKPYLGVVKTLQFKKAIRVYEQRFLQKRRR
jgi:hypothetical protein